MANSYVQKWIPLPDRYNDRQLKLIGDQIIEYIKNRTEAGHGKDAGWRGLNSWSGDRFPGYSDAYKASLDFKIAGKAGKPVNLTLSGDMLAELDVLETKPNKIKIGYEEGTDEAGRAEGNIRGTYGRQRGSKDKARDFLGLSGEVVEKIIKHFKKRIEALE